MWTIREYTQDKLPAEIRELVKSRFYDFNIFYTGEVKSAGGIVYMMKLEGKATWKMIKVVDGEITVLNDYTKK